MRKSALFAALILALAITASADTYIVRPDGTGDFPTIQAAIDAVSAGDTIELADGNRDIDYLGKAITIRSQSDNPSLCTIDCQGSSADEHRAFRFHGGEDSTAHLESIAITGGHHPQGGAIHLAQASPTITNCIFFGNTSGTGGAVHVGDDSALRLVGCDFDSNSVSHYGGGIYCQSFFSVEVTIDGCRFRGNTAESTGGAAYVQGADVQFIECVFSGNDSPSGGAVCCFSAGNATLFDHCLFEGNTAGSGGAIDCDYTLLTLTGCTMIDNRATSSGGCISCYSSDPQIVNCTLWANSAPHGAGVA